MAKRTWAYDCSNEELTKKFWEALARAAVSGSGLVISFTGGYERAEAFYLYGVVLSRLEGKRPPFTPGDRVRISPDATYQCHSVNTVGEYYSLGKSQPDTEYEVAKVYYEKQYRPHSSDHEYVWTLSFAQEEMVDYRFPADRFEKVKQKELSPT